MYEKIKYLKRPKNYTMKVILYRLYKELFYKFCTNLIAEQIRHIFNPMDYFAIIT